MTNMLKRGLATSTPLRAAIPRQVGRQVGRKIWATGISLACLLIASPAAPAQTVPTARQQVQHVFRRFTFGEPPETVTAVTTSGIAPWLAQQLTPANIDDTGTVLETLPTAKYSDYNIWERSVMQHMLLTNRQVQAKLEMHWLDHFSVSLNTVGDPALMQHYDATIRANALGNFQTLLAAVSKEAAMLRWLGNDGNVPPTPNENFGRELMQLYTTGEFTLNPDGSQKLNAHGGPILNYTENDVKAVAKAMTGYSLSYNSTNTNPQTAFSVLFTKTNHYHGSLILNGKTYTVPNDTTAIDYVCSILAHRPETAIYETKQMLQRFATETPSAQYVTDVAAVWKKTVDKPDQIAQVITAIINHPEFNTSYHAMLKQPVELLFGPLRMLSGKLQATANVAPAGSLQYELSSLGQQIFYPPSVFSFYPPGSLASIVNTRTMLTKSGITANISGATPGNTYVDTYIDIPTLRTRVGSINTQIITDYLLDALIDGGSPELHSTIAGFLGAKPSDNQIRGAIWLILNTPDYGVN